MHACTMHACMFHACTFHACMHLKYVFCVYVCVQGVQRLLRTRLATNKGREWQAKYAIADLDDPRYVFVPSCSPPQCKVFYAAHTRGESGSHVLLWMTNHPVLVQVEPLAGGTELTFDYGAHYRAVAEDKGPRAVTTAREEDMELSLSLSTGSDDSTLTGVGQKTEKGKNKSLVKRIEEHARTYGEMVDMDPLFGFGLTPSP